MKSLRFIFALAVPSLALLGCGGDEDPLFAPGPGDNTAGTGGDGTGGEAGGGTGGEGTGGSDGGTAGSGGGQSDGGTDASPFCGDGVVQPEIAEACEPGSPLALTCADLGFPLGTPSCSSECKIDSSTCRQPTCGDGEIEASEVCDDADTQGGDGCSPSCTLEPDSFCYGEPSTCVVGGNTCDKAIALTAGSHSYPRGTFTDEYGPYQGVCGFDKPGPGADAVFAVTLPGRSKLTASVSGAAANNAVLVATKGCDTVEANCVVYGDSGSVEYTNAQSSAITIYLVVDGLQGSSTSMFTVDVDIHQVVCGDGLVELDEACDDKNADSNDGCSSACAVEIGYQCFGAPSWCFQGGDTCGNPVDITPGSYGFELGGFVDDYTSLGSCYSLCSFVCTGGYGADAVFRMTVPPNNLLTAKVTGDAEVALTTACTDFTAQCLDGASSATGATYHNQGAQAQTVLIVVDDDPYGSSGSEQVTLETSLTGLLSAPAGDMCSSAIPLQTGSHDYNLASFHNLLDNVYATCCDWPCVGFGVHDAGPDAHFVVTVPGEKTLNVDLLAQTSTLSMWIATDCNQVGKTCTKRYAAEPNVPANATFTNITTIPRDVYLIVDSEDAAAAGAFRLVVHPIQ